MKKLNYDKLVNVLFGMLCIFTIIAYAYHAILTIVNGECVLWTYSEISVDNDIISFIFNYTKDIIAVILFVCLSFRKRKISKISVCFFIVVMYGSVILYLSDLHSIAYIVGGIRSYLVFVSTLLYFDFRRKNILLESNGEKKSNYNFDKAFIKLLQIILVFETFCVFAQVLNSGTWTIGNGIYRFVGTFGNSGGLGNYCIGMTMMLIAYSLKIEKGKFLIRLLQFVMIVFNVWASGMRSAIVMVLFMICAYIFILLYNRLQLNKKNIFIIFFLLCIIVGVPLINIVTKSIGRGQLMLSGGTRIDLFFSLFNQNAFPLLFGQGLGKGTNTAYLLGATGAELYDSTFSNVVSQFGLIGLFIFVMALIKIAINLYNKSLNNKFMTLIFMIPILCIILIGSFFEQFVLIVLAIYSFYIMTSEEYVKSSYNNDTY